jgi:hypothetical protein
MRTAAASTVIGLVAMLTASCDSDESSTPGTAEGPVGGTFVGEVEGANELTGVAVRLDPDGSEQRVRIYLCDHSGHARWLSGSLDGGRGTVTDKSGDVAAALVVDADEVTGTLTNGEGATFPFEARRAESPAGLYSIRQGEHGTLVGASPDGALLTAQRVRRGTHEYAARYVVVDLDGTEHAFSGPVTAPTGRHPFAPPGTLGMSIVLADDGTAVGAFRRAAAVTSGSARFIDPNIDPFIDENTTPFIDENSEPFFGSGGIG